jgi:hypothetical protein
LKQETSNGLDKLHGDMRKLLDEEWEKNPVSYKRLNKNQDYQTYERIKFQGLRWSAEKRIKEYGIYKYVKKGDRVLDIGSNMGFIAIELAVVNGAIAHGIEPNPWLVKLSELVAKYLGVGDRTAFFDAKFEDMKITQKYNVVLTLAAFHTGDGREREEVNAYFNRCYDLIEEGGYIIYESCSYNTANVEFHHKSAKEAMRKLAELFTTIESVTKPSGSPGWARDYFIGQKKAKK